MPSDDFQYTPAAFIPPQQLTNVWYVSASPILVLLMADEIPARPYVMYLNNLSQRGGVTYIEDGYHEARDGVWAFGYSSKGNFSGAPIVN